MPVLAVCAGKRKPTQAEGVPSGRRQGPSKLAKFAQGKQAGGSGRLELHKLHGSRLSEALRALRTASAHVWVLETSIATQLRPETTASGKVKATPSSSPTALLMVPYRRQGGGDGGLVAGSLVSLHLDEPRASLPLEAFQALQHVLEGVAPIECFDAYSICSVLLNVLPKDLIKVNEWHAFRDVKVAAWLLDSGRMYSQFHLAAQLCDVTLAKRGDALGTTSSLFVTAALREDLGCLHRVMTALLEKLKAQRLADIFWNLEMPILPLLAQMGAAGVGVDCSELRRHQSLLARKLSSLESLCHKAAGHKFLVSSPAQLRVVLYEGGSVRGPQVPAHAS